MQKQLHNLIICIYVLYLTIPLEPLHAGNNSSSKTKTIDWSDTQTTSYDDETTQIQAEIGFHGIQGYREAMEDAHVIKTIGDLTFYGVFDGHSGKTCALLLAEYLPSAIAQYYKDNKILSKKTITQIFYDVDKKIKDTLNSYDDSGSTAILVIVNNKTNQIYIANTGDSRALIKLNNGSLKATTDHKLNDSEKKRIQKAGGYIAYGRVGEILAIPRAFGNFRYGNKITGVIVTPDVYTVKQKDIKYMVLACDGVWDVLKNEIVSDLVDSELKKETSVEKITKRIVNKAYLQDSKDNITALLVHFKKIKSKTTE